MMNEAKLRFLAEGEKINDEFTIYEPAITGLFIEDTNFIEGVHTCIVNSHVTKVVQTMLSQVKGTYNGLNLENGGAAIDSIVDSTTGAISGEVTSGKAITIHGKKIRIIPEDGETAESCITFTNVDTHAIIEQEDVLIVNDPSKIILQLPTLPAGIYSLTIKTLYSNTSINLKAPRYITTGFNIEVK
jgi:hypothetical protein